MLHEGEIAPAFSLPDQNKVIWQLAAQKGKWTLVYFYPKDDTPGCTKEACAIRDVYDDFERMDVGVFGVSKDTPESHRAFCEKYGLPFTLLSDVDGKMIEEYGAWKETTSSGVTSSGIARVSYLIGPDLTIVKTYPDVDPANHALQILQDLKTYIG